MDDMRFAAFLPPHHPVGENPALIFRRELDFCTHIDELGFDEIWVGEHHSSGWETIASPEMFLAAAAERTHYIKLCTGVVSLPYHHPFMVAQRIIQLDHQARGRMIFGTGPGALTVDARMLGIDPMVLRKRQDESLGIIKRLMSGEKITYKSDWFELVDAELQLLPFQKNMEIATTASASPAGMQLAGKYGLGVISLSTAAIGMKDHWAIAEASAAQHGNTISRDGWRIRMSFHLAETQEQAEREAAAGYMHYHNEYIVATLSPEGKGRVDSTAQLLDMIRNPSGPRMVVIGTPDQAVEAIREVYEASGGFGCVLALAHDWANREATFRSWELLARYVVPEVRGLTRELKASYDYSVANRGDLMGVQMAAIAKAGEK